MRKFAARLGYLFRSYSTILPEGFVIPELKSAWIGLVQNLQDCRSIRSVPRERSSQEYINKSMHYPAWSVRRISQWLIRANCMMQTGRCLEGKPSPRGSAQKVGQILPRRNRFGRQSASADLRESVLNSIQWNFAICW
jgi:hypothetical protein